MLSERLEFDMDLNRQFVLQAEEELAELRARAATSAPEHVKAPIKARIESAEWRVSKLWGALRNANRT